MGTSSIVSSVSSGVNSVLSNAVGQLNKEVGLLVHGLTPTALKVLVIYVNQAQLIGRFIYVLGWFIGGIAFLFLAMALWGSVSMAIKYRNNSVNNSISISFIKDTITIGLLVGIPMLIPAAILLYNGFMRIHNPYFYAINNLLMSLASLRT